MVGIYKITSPSGKIYIGQSWNLENRFYDYSKLYGVKGQRILYNSFLKYGVENHKFEVIHELPADIDQSILDTYEILYISQYRECGVEMLNLKEGGSHGKHSEESKKRMSIGMKGRTSPNKGKVMSEETKQKLSKTRKLKYSGKNHPLYGKKRSEETKRKISEKRKGQLGGFKNKVHSNKTKDKIRNKLKGNIPWNKGKKFKNNEVCQSAA